MGEGRELEPGDSCDGPAEEPSEKSGRQGVEKQRTKPSEGWACVNYFCLTAAQNRDGRTGRLKMGLGARRKVQAGQ